MTFGDYQAAGTVTASLVLMSVHSLTLTVEVSLGERVAYLTLPSCSSSSYPNWRKLSWFELMLTLLLHTANTLACGTTPSFRTTSTELSAFSLEFLSLVWHWKWGNRNLGIISLLSSCTTSYVVAFIPSEDGHVAMVSGKRGKSLLPSATTWSSFSPLKSKN